MTKIRFEKLHKQFGTTAAVDHIDLVIEPGEIFFVLGPSGCGKSTLLRLIAGLHTPTSGKIYFNDRDVTSLSTAKRNAAMCFQSYALWPHMTVRENIRFGLDVRKMPGDQAEKAVNDVIKLVQMEPYAERKPNELSGGQQQRVALARALVVRPACLLLDEPLSNLDAKLRLEMRTEIRRICKSSGLTAVYVTHDQKEALSIADRMVVLDHGKIEQLGKPQDMYLHPHNKFVANFMGETNFIEGSVIDSTPKTTRVKTRFGTLVSEWSAKTFSPGSNVTISIRPESVRMGQVVSSNQRNVFDATLSDTIYLGEMAQHLVHVGANGTETLFRAFELNPKFVARDGAVQAVRVSLDPTDVVILDD